MNYASAIVRNGEVVGGMLATPDHPGHAPALPDAVKAELASAIAALPSGNDTHLVELYQPAHPEVVKGHVQSGLHINGRHMRAALEPDTP